MVGENTLRIKIEDIQIDKKRLTSLLVIRVEIKVAPRESRPL